MRICLVCEGISETDQDVCASCGLRLVNASEVHFPVRRGEEDAGNPLLGALVDGKYRITNVLGKGGMGTVFRAVHEVSLVPVALKILHPRFAARAEYREHFLAEARKAGRVVHEHSSRVLDVGEDADGTVYIAMELVEGLTLADWIHGEDPLTPAEVVDVMYQICQALVVAHDVGLVHRDLSPRNVMGLVREGRPFVKILDFGISKASTAPFGEPSPWEMTGLFASPPYSAPEYLAGDEVDARADLYSLGVIAFEALTRKLPVVGSDKHELAAATIEGRRRPLKPPAGTPSRLVRLIQRLLSRDPAQRPAGARDVQRELYRILHPQRQALRIAAVVALLVTLPAFLVTHAETVPPFLRVVAGGPFQVEKDGDVPFTLLRREQLENVQFRYGGSFRPHRLTIYTSSGALLPGPVVDSASSTFSLTAANSRWMEFVNTLAAMGRDIELSFGQEGREEIWRTRLLVDDDPPELDFESSVAELSGGSEMQLTWHDKSDVVGLEIEVSAGNGWSETFRLEPAAKRIRLADALQGLPGPNALHDVHIVVRARDRAEQRAELPYDFASVDLRAPGIENVTGRQGGTRVTHDDAGARLWLELDGSEVGARLLVEAASGESWPVALTSEKLQTILLVPRGEPGFADGTYRFRVEDAAGNRSAAFDKTLTFEREDRAAELAVAPASAACAAIIGDQILTDGSEVWLEFTCNDLYRPLLRAPLRRVTGDAPDEVLALEEVVLGGGRLRLPPLPAGKYDLRLGLEDLEGDERYSVEVQPAPRPFVVDVRDPAALRFMRGVILSGLLRRSDDNSYRCGSALDFGDDPFVEGRFWFGDPDHPQSRDLGDADEMARPISIVPGESVLAVELSDRLGRRRPVRVGSQPAVSLEVGTGIADVLARFHHTEEGPLVTPGRIDVEPGQRARLRVSIALPLRPEHHVELLLGEDPIPAEFADGDVREGTARFSFPLDYADLAKEVRWPVDGAMPADQEARGVEATLRSDVCEPYPIEFEVRPTRTTLREISWQALSPQSLPPALRDLQMLPVLGPGPGVAWQDPVSPSIARRADFRPMPKIDVEEIGDIYLQDRELTAAQYEALRLAAGSFGPAPDPERFTHPWDPDRANRMRRLIPAIEAEDPDQPVVGVNFFQAYTIARIAGCVFAGNAPGNEELFRLPMGVELEIAALFTEGRPRASELHGADEMTYDRLEELGTSSPWPPSVEFAGPLGDFVSRVVVGREPDRFYGLDFGVCEWVLDLPCWSEEDSLVRTWIKDHPTHIQRGQGRGRQEDLQFDPRTFVRTLGVVRGLASNDAAKRVDTNLAHQPEISFGVLPKSVPGVVRAQFLRRDGQGLLLDGIAPELPLIGFRLAGGEAFVRRVREAH